MSESRVARVLEVVAAGAVVAAAALAALGPVPTQEQWIAAAFFATFGLLAASLTYKTSTSTGGTIAFLPFLSVAAVTPNIAAVLSVLAGMLGSELMARRPARKAFFNVSQQVLAESLAIGVFLLLGGTSALIGPPPVLAFVALVTTYMTVNKLAVSTIVCVASDRPLVQHWVQSMRGSFVYDLLAVPLVLFFAFAYGEFGAAWSATMALPILGLRQLYKTNFDLQKINEELLQLMVAAIEARDPYTSGHSQRVARYARVVAKAAGIGGREAERIVVAALLHDVGKIHEEFAPILHKPGRLTDEEFEIMKAHSARGSALIGKVSHFADLVPLVHSHHEAWDGRGYPAGLAGEQIPLGARVIAFADTIDAMSTSRPYRSALSAEEVRAEIRRESGRQFDPRISNVLIDYATWREVEREIKLAVGEHPVFGQQSMTINELATSQAVAS